MQFVLKIQQAEKGSVRRGVCTIGAWSQKAGARRRTRMPKPHRQRCVYIVVVTVVVPHMCLCRSRWYLKSTYPPPHPLLATPSPLPHTAPFQHVAHSSVSHNNNCHFRMLHKYSNNKKSSDECSSSSKKKRYANGICVNLFKNPFYQYYCTITKRNK